MPIPSYTVRCIHNQCIAKDIYEIHFEKPEGFTFKAGQFILFDVPLIEDRNDIQTRAFSIASSPDEKHLIFGMKMKEGGRASRWIMEELKPNDTMRMQGPFGVFTIPETIDKEILMICTSTGNAPFRSQLSGLLAGGFSKRIDLLYGVRTEEDLFWQDYFDDLAQRYENFFVHYAISQPSENWKGHKGRVQSLFTKVVQDWSAKQIYVCGNPAMTKDIKTQCVEEHGVDKKSFHMEGYI